MSSSCDRARGLIATSKLWAGPSWEVWCWKLGELPGHPGPDGVAEKHLEHLKGRGELAEYLPMGQVLDGLDLSAVVVVVVV